MEKQNCQQNNIIQEDQESVKNTKGSLTIILVAGLPGIGKSTLFNNIIKVWINRYGFRVIKAESDTFRQAAIKAAKLIPENGHLSALELEIKSKPDYRRRMHKQIRQHIVDLSKFEGRSIFVMDKNFVPEKLRQLIFSAAAEHYQHYDSYFLLPVQLQEEDMKITLDNQLNPFTRDTLCASLIRSFSRKGHISLCHGFSHSLKCIVNTLRSYSGDDFQEIANNYGMKILLFDFYNAKKLREEPLRSILSDKMDQIVGLVNEGDYNGDKFAEILLSDSNLLSAICSYESYDKEYARIALEVANIA